jgi:outer membrane lipoprotein
VSVQINVLSRVRYDYACLRGFIPSLTSVRRIDERNRLTLRKRRESLYLILILFVTGCASSQVPQGIRHAPAGAVAVSEVQQEPDRFLEQRVRWGGTIIAVHNRKRTTEIEILSRPLASNGEPRAEAPGEGRFIAQLVGFADPTEYPQRRLLTVAGRLEQVQIRPVGEYPYPYPVVAVEQTYLWPEPPVQQPYWYPYVWYDPWYPWGWPWYY